jgi:hypothetical protein
VSLNGRLTSVAHKDGGRTYCLDGAPLLVMGPIILEPFRLGVETLTAYREVQTLV